MNGTPRLRSAFPATPGVSAKKPGRDGAAQGRAGLNSPLQSVDGKNDAEQPHPLIPFDTIDAPTQRFYVFAFWVGLLSWRLYDFYLLLLDDTESLWLFMKWAAIDATFLYGVPALRIPWLEWSPVTVTILFVLHAICNIMLMFRIMPPIQAPLVYMAKVLWDKELAISERRVKAADILHNSSLILGKQTIHILPEGSALLNPHSEPFCLDSSRKEVFLPIMVNQTNPVSVELLRTDLETSKNETLSISASKLRSMRKEAEKIRRANGGLPSDPLLLRYPVKNTGVYKLQRMVDESKLEVQARRAEVTVVSCPAARIKTREANKCRGELSDLTLEVEGTPPLKVKYQKVVNRQDQKVTLQSIQPRDYHSAAGYLGSFHQLVPTTDTDISWARKQSVVVPLNESLVEGGIWRYAVAEVEDRLGNLITYATGSDSKTKGKGAGLQQELLVHERPRLRFTSCSSQRPLMVAKGSSAFFALGFNSTDNHVIQNTPYEIEYFFTPEGRDADDNPQLNRLSLKPSEKGIQAAAPGQYTLKSVSTAFCEGEVMEPASCGLKNPPEPQLTLTATEDYEKCAGRPIGLRAQLDFVGTPPFDVFYKTERKGAPQSALQRKRFTGMSGELMLGSPFAGYHKYTFTEIADSVYGKRAIKDTFVDQEVKAIARAEFTRSDRRRVCIGEGVEFEVRLQGEAPWTLEYQLGHGGKRVDHGTVKIEQATHTLRTGPLQDGGNYTMSLLSVTDSTDCKEILSDEVSIYVQMNRPRASFASVDGKRRAQVLEGAKQELPIRLSGEGPWTVGYRNVDKSPDKVIQKMLRSENDRILVDGPGTYELVDVRDSLCPGVVESSASQFEASWIPRPQISIPESSVVKEKGGKFIKHEVCEGDEDNVELRLNGAPPFDINYVVELLGGRRYTKQIVVPQKTPSLRMDTEKAGLVQYSFSQPGDGHYKTPRSKDQGLVLSQQVNPRPMAKFNEQGKTYNYCSADVDGEQIIPITLTGQPPFHIEVEIKHQSSNKPNAASFPNIPSTRYDLRLPHRMLPYGTSNVRIRKVRDGHGCQRSIDDASARVLVSVHNAPTITPLEQQTHFCVGDRLSFSLSGAAPFDVYYTFNGVAQRAHSYGTAFRRIAERPGTFVITGVQDKASPGDCRATTEITKVIHEMPSVRVSQGREAVVDIHEGGTAEILFEFGGTPPFEFTYTRSENAKKGKKGRILETRKEISYEHSMRVRASEEGTYEVVSIKDAHCSFSKPGMEDGRKGQKLLQY